MRSANERQPFDPVWKDVRRVILSLFCLQFLLWGPGCGRSKSVRDLPVSEWNSTQSTDYLQAVLRQYQSCRSYRDRATLELSYEYPAGKTVERTELAFEFSRPNQFHLEVARGENRLSVRSNGTTLWSSIDDPETNHLRNQVVQRGSAANTSVDEIYAATEMLDPADAQQMVSVLQGLPLGLHLTEVGLLLPNSSFEKLFETISHCDVAERATGVSSQTRFVFDAQTESGRFVIHVDPQRKLITRIDFPTDELFRDRDESERPIHVGLTLTLSEIEIDAVVNRALFAHGTSAAEQVVQYFVLPPPPHAFPVRLGEQIERLTFCSDAADGDLSQRGGSNAHDPQGKISVLCWFDTHDASRVILPRLSQLAERYDQQGDVMFLAIHPHSTDEVSPERLRALMQQWGVRLPVVRDLEAQGRDYLGITAAPTVCILDRNRRLHQFVIGANPQLSEVVDGTVRRLLKGDDVAADAKQSIVRAEQQFVRQLQLAAANAQSQAASSGSRPPDRLPKDEAANSQAATLPPVNAPTKFSVQPNWQLTSDSIGQVGNLLVTANGSGELRVLAIRESREIVVINAGGQVVSTHDLPLADDEGITQLRTAIGSDGHRYYVVFAQFGPFVDVLDSRFARVLRYPNDGADPDRAGIIDARLMDLDADKKLELYVGFAAPDGMHRVAIEPADTPRTKPGQTEWTLSEGGSASSIARSWTNVARLWVPTDQGTVLPVLPAGQPQRPMAIGHRTVYLLADKQTAEPRATDFLGMSYTVDGRSIAVGLDDRLQERWAYGLPGGRFRYQVHSPVGVSLDDGERSLWLLAGPDGSVHMVRDDGSEFDAFQLGQHITGLAAYANPKGTEEIQLYVATDVGLQSFSVKLPSAN